MEADQGDRTAGQDVDKVVSADAPPIRECPTLLARGAATSSMTPHIGGTNISGFEKRKPPKMMKPSVMSAPMAMAEYAGHALYSTTLLSTACPRMRDNNASLTPKQNRGGIG